MSNPTPVPKQSNNGEASSPDTPLGSIPDAWPVVAPEAGTSGSDRTQRRRAPKKKWRRKTKRLLFLIPAILLILVLIAWQLIPRLLPSGDQTSEALRLGTVTRGDLIVSITGSGPLKPVGKRTVSAETDTTLTEIFFRNGDSVTTGDLLMRLDPSDAESALLEATGNLEEALDARTRQAASCPPSSFARPSAAV